MKILSFLRFFLNSRLELYLISCLLLPTTLFAQLADVDTYFLEDDDFYIDEMLVADQTPIYDPATEEYLDLFEPEEYFVGIDNALIAPSTKEVVGQTGQSCAMYYFGSEHCPPCKALRPKVESLLTNFNIHYQYFDYQHGGDPVVNLFSKYDVGEFPAVIIWKYEDTESGRVSRQVYRSDGCNSASFTAAALEAWANGKNSAISQALDQNCKDLTLEDMPMMP